MIHAYFISGQEDLTKKVLDTDWPSVYFPTRPESPERGAEGSEVDDPVFRQHHYRFYGHMPGNIAIYHYEGTW
jgi:hypothetical protein